MTTKQQALKLSEMDDSVEISYEESGYIIKAGELKRHIIEKKEKYHDHSDWYTIKRKQWKPNARYMVETYIEQEHERMYEDWDERAMACMSEAVLNNLQLILDEAFEGEEAATVYWSYETPVEIDVFPPSSDEQPE